MSKHDLIIWIFLQNATQKSQKVFVHVPSEIAAHEVEEIGMHSDEICPLFLFHAFATSISMGIP